MHDIAWIVDQPTDAGLLPRPIVLAPLSGRKGNVHLLRWVAMIWIGRLGRHDRYAYLHLVAWQQGFGSDDDRIGMAFVK